MTATKQVVSQLLSAFADSLNAMDEHEFELLIQGKAKLRLVQKEKKLEKKSSVDRSSLSEAVIMTAEKLNHAESREEAGTLLASIDHTGKKDFLLALSRACGVSVSSKDNIAKLEQKLIDNTVGARLRTDAIRNLSL